MNITFVSPDYPGEGRSTFTFVKQLVDEISNQGNSCIVVAPYGYKPWQVLSRHKTLIENDGRVTIIRPPFLLLPNIYLLGFSLSQYIRRKSVTNVLNTLSKIPDVIYGHFWSSAFEAYNYAKKNNIPLFVATGESVITRLFKPSKKTKAFSEYIKGVVCVSLKNKEESIHLGLTIPEKCEVFPNAINDQVFFKRDKAKCRSSLKISNDKFIVSFVGWFSERKGSKRLSEAISRSKFDDIYSFFIGSGIEQPYCNNIIYKGLVSHNELPLYLNASDVFVLPTLNEGCCNAIIEAMACGLPIISSNLEFNHDILDHTNSIMVDPMNVNEIKKAIDLLREDQALRNQLSKGAIETAKKLTISKRAKNIIDFIYSKIN